MTFYSKFMSSVVPPFSFLNSRTRSSDNIKDDINSDKKTAAGFTGSDTPGEEVDIAETVGEDPSIGNCVNLLTASQMVEGIENLKWDDERNDRIDDPKFNEATKLSQIAAQEEKNHETKRRGSLENGDKPKQGPNKIEYDLYESEEEDSSDDENSDSRAQAHEGSSTAPDTAQATGIGFNEVQGPSKLSLDKPSNRTPFQQSVLENLNPYLFNESYLMKLSGHSNTHPVTVKDFYDSKRDVICLSIAERLKLVFNLDDDDYFRGNYNVWLVREVLLQGHIYLTKKCVLFFSFLPRTFEDQTKRSFKDEYRHDDSYKLIQEGSLGKKTANYYDAVFTSVITHRFWAILRPETLSLYNSATDLYFPVLVIDLKNCVNAELMEKEYTKRNTSGIATQESEERMVFDEKNISSMLDNEGNANYSEDAVEDYNTGTWFKVLTKKKTYKFYADSLYTARQWVNNITKLIFQFHNSNANNEVLMKIPIESIDYIRKQNLLDNSLQNNSTETDPLLFALNHKAEDQQSNHNLSTSNTKQKVNNSFRNKNGGASLSSNLSVFLFFKDGDSFYDQFLNWTLFKKGSESTLQYASSEDVVSKACSSSSDHSKSFSTLNQLNTNNNIINQILNIKQMKNDSHPPSHLGQKNTPVNSSNSSLASESTHGSVIKDIGKTFTSSAKLLTRKRSYSVPALLNKLTPEKKQLPTLDSEEHIPIVISSEKLKGLDMSLVASEKVLDNLDKRYERFKKNEDPEDSIVFEKIRHPKSVTLSPDLDLDGISHSSPLYLSDPKELHVAKENKKKNKLASFGRSIWAMSCKFTAINHFEEFFVDDPYYVSDLAAKEVSARHFRQHFSFNNEENLVATYYSHLQRSVPVFGKVYIGENEVCFRSLTPGVSTKMILPLQDIEFCHNEKGLNLAYSGLVLVLKGYEEIFMEFYSQKARDDCEVIIGKLMSKCNPLKRFSKSPSNDLSNVKNKEKYISAKEMTRRKYTLALSRRKIENARLKLFEDRLNEAAGLDIPLLLEESPFYKTEIKLSTSFNFVLLTIGSRGDVQPYVALAKGLMKEGHHVTIATHSEFQTWVEGYGISFKSVAGDPTELMSLMVKHSTLSVSFFKEASSRFRRWINELLITSWEACQGADILIESPSAMGGIHIAEALGIPYMRAFTMPWTRTRAYPHAFIVPDQKKGGSYNYLTHVMFENVFWRGISGQINKWRVNDLGLPRTNLYKLAQYKVPFLYNISPTVFPPSVDFPDWVKVNGYWFLEDGNSYDAPSELLEFIKNARNNGKKIVYVGFGSIVVKNAQQLTKAIAEAVLNADVRCILNRGWSDRLKKEDESEVELPKEIYDAGTIPHEWLFPRIDAAVHHGGSGTTGATLKAGVPAIIKPFFGDQFFYASRVEDLGVGIVLRKLNEKSFTKALLTVTTDSVIMEKSKKVGEKIRSENGVADAIAGIYSMLEYARTIVISKQQANESSRSGLSSGLQTPHENESDNYLDTEHNSESEEDNSDTLGDNPSVKSLESLLITDSHPQNDDEVDLAR
ncbi:Piso0_005120 [Millerozyma farinosa CBS 7064]|uniref:Sterol 3-beta-glucosyltransferase n=1 Tax=Pichia sorbitophila (strain ATCC MYA-4447 / BCRC 22081 / CBS 7064 / NBRC 10061 / NRRL Y-12695) TaxID=559304 RepID=G8Y4A1_PICSO|nr:Piso0_005120 [Millerozyma farinosa CBS 7064]